MRQAARLSPEAEHTVWWLLLCRAVERASRAAALREAAELCDSLVANEIATGKVDHNEMAWTQACAIALRARAEGGT